MNQWFVMTPRDDATFHFSELDQLIARIDSLVDACRLFRYSLGSSVSQRLARQARVLAAECWYFQGDMNRKERLEHHLGHQNRAFCEQERRRFQKIFALIEDDDAEILRYRSELKMRIDELDDQLRIIFAQFKRNFIYPTKERFLAILEDDDITLNQLDRAEELARRKLYFQEESDDDDHPSSRREMNMSEKRLFNELHNQNEYFEDDY